MQILKFEQLNAGLQKQPLNEKHERKDLSYSWKQPECSGVNVRLRLMLKILEAHGNQISIFG